MKTIKIQKRINLQWIYCQNLIVRAVKLKWVNKTNKNDKSKFTNRSNPRGCFLQNWQEKLNRKLFLEIACIKKRTIWKTCIWITNQNCVELKYFFLFMSIKTKEMSRQNDTVLKLPVFYCKRFGNFKIIYTRFINTVKL